MKFQTRQNQNDGYGNTVGAWADVAGLDAVPARIAPVRGSEGVLQEKLKGTGIVEITVRSSVATRAIDTDSAIEDLATGVRYNIRHIANMDERQRYLTMTCERGVNDG